MLGKVIIREETTKNITRGNYIGWVLLATFKGIQGSLGKQLNNFGESLRILSGKKLKEGGNKGVQLKHAR